MNQQHKIKQLHDIYNELILEAQKQLENHESQKLLILQQKLDKIYQQYLLTQKSRQIYQILSLNYYLLAKFLSSFQKLQRALQCLKISRISQEKQICWILQLAALYSAYKNHQKAYNLACFAIEKSFKAISEIKKEDQTKKLIQLAQNQYSSDNSQFLSWFYNSNNIIKQIPKKYDPILYFHDDLQIADIMAMKILPIDYFQVINCDQIILKLILYISIGCFTRATQKYYRNNLQERQYHLRSIRLGLLIFRQRSLYMQFLISTFQQHFGKYLSPINEQNSQINELRRYLPKDSKQKSLKNMILMQ